MSINRSKVASDVQARTTDTSEDKFETKTLFNRTYQAFSLEHQANLEPIDGEEEERLRAQHETLKKIFSHRIDPLLPDSVKDPRKILDCGFGTGDWAIEIAELYPDCVVFGLDICPVLVDQNERPENFIPQLADLNVPEQSFNFSTDTFDFVSSRFVAGGIAQTRWPSYVTDIRRILRRGGAVEFIEWDLYFRSDRGNGDRLSALRQWSATYFGALASGHGNGRKSASSPPDLESMLRASGFQNVSAVLVDVPVSGWGTDAQSREVGEETQKNVEAMLVSNAIYPIVGRNLMTETNFRDLARRCVEECSNTSSEIYLRLLNCYGEKP